MSVDTHHGTKTRLPSLGGTHVKYGGLVVAFIGFALTRYTVAESARFTGGFVEFVVAKGLFILLGLGIAVVGVGLAVSTHDATYVSIVAWWTLIGVGVMGAVVVATTLAAPGTLSNRESHLVANVLLGSTVGGLLTGFRSAARYRQRQTLRSQADRMTTLNRLLRHEVLNKVNVIRGYATVAADGGAVSRADPRTVIERNAAGIDEAIEQVGVLTRAETDDAAIGAFDVATVVERAAATVRNRYPAATVRVSTAADADIRARADDTLDVVVTQLLDNAVKHAEHEDPTIEVCVEADETSVAITVDDDGPGLDAEQQALLAGGSLPEYDDPTTGFGLTIVRLLVDRLDGCVSATVGDDGTTVRVELPRASGARGIGVEPSTLASVGVVAVTAGVAMGLVLQTATGRIGVIGSLYGVASPPVGWVTHLSHSVVFGLVLVALRTHPLATPLRRGPLSTVASAVAFGLGLWVVAAGLLMPLWLRILGFATPLPNLDLVGLVGHLVWGLVLGGGLSMLDSR